MLGNQPSQGYRLEIKTSSGSVAKLSNIRTKSGRHQKQIIRVSKCKIHEINTDKDHIHILFESKPQVQLSKLVNNYKTVTSRCLRKEFAEELKPYYWKPYFWSDSYFICSVSDRSHAAVEAYIKDQGR